jgi:L-2-hydroxyglutarate oxidase
VAAALADEIRQLGARIAFSAEVTGIKNVQGQKQVTAGNTVYLGRYLINCSGLHSDRIAVMDGLKPGVRVVPFRGEYYQLQEASRSMVKHLIYPVPDPAFPFLGVHFTRMINGSVECGPNAVVALRREGYTRMSVSIRDLWDMATFPGVIKLFMKHWRKGAGEYRRSFSKRAFVGGLRKLVPCIRPEHLQPAPAGVRAQAVTREGQTLDDFLFKKGKNSLHVLNAPSPAATASLAIGEEIRERFIEIL